MEKIRINYTGWMEVSKDELNIVDLDNNKIETSDLSSEQVIGLLDRGEAILKSFGETHSHYALDGEDDWTFEKVEED